MDFKLGCESAKYSEGFGELLKERGYACESGITVKMTELPEKKIAVAYQNGQAEITAPSKTFLFRGLMTLVMHLEETGEDTGFFESEEIYLDENGCMVDCSRNCVMNIEAAKAWIRMQAAVGMNIMMLYTEDTYEVEGYPYFGALRGRFTKEELKELDKYADVFGIELIPCIQTLGHLQQPLRWPAMRELRDTSDIVLVGDEKVYDFIRACVRQVSECFSTRRVHLGMDEAWSLGLGKYLIQNGYTPKREIIRQHMDRVMEICQEEGLQPMIWSDMYFRPHSATEEYYDVPFDADMKDGVIPPEGLTLVYWDYYHLDEDFYCNYMRLHRELTENVAFAGGGWTWNALAPAIQTGYAVTHPAYNACRKAGIRSAIYTLWGDDSTETPMFSALGPVLLAAEYGFGEKPDEACIRRKFEFLTGCDYDAYLELGNFDLISGELTEENLSADPSRCLFFQDLLLGSYDGQTEGVRYGEYFKKLEEKIAGAKNSNDSVKGCWADEMKLILEFYRKYAQILSVKADLGLEILDAYKAKDAEKLRSIAVSVIPELVKQVEDFRRLREKIWNAEGKIFGWEILDIRFLALKGRMESAAERLIAYADGELCALPELDEERIPYLPKLTGERRMDGRYGSWINIISASPLAWGWMPQ